MAGPGVVAFGVRDAGRSPPRPAHRDVPALAAERQRGRPDRQSRAFDRPVLPRRGR